MAASSVPAGSNITESHRRSAEIKLDLSTHPMTPLPPPCIAITRAINTLVLHRFGKKGNETCDMTSFFLPVDIKKHQYFVDFVVIGNRN